MGASAEGQDGVDTALAAEVARGLNNLIMVIAGCGDLLGEHIPAQPPARPLLIEIQRASARAKLLARVLSVMLGKEKIRPETIDLPTFAGDLRGLLVPFLGERIDLFTTIDPTQIGRPRADPGVLACALIRIAAHARAALVDGGRLAMRAADVRGADAIAPTTVHLMLQLGTSAGAAPLEPMAGLDALAALVRRAGAELSYEPDPPTGSIYRIVLPRVEDGLAVTPASEGGAATVLVVDDEPAIRKICTAHLASIGCRVISCASGREALEAVDARGMEAIDLLLTDVVMPEMGGTALAKKLLEKRPTLPVLFMSGYAEEVDLLAAVTAGRKSGGGAEADAPFEFLQKPFVKAALVSVVQRMIGRLTQRKRIE